MTKKMTKWQRLEAAIRGDTVDRIPFTLWKHYHLQDRAPRRLAEATVNLHHQFDTDLIKLTPSNLYAIQDWGPTIRFGRDDHTAPVVIQPVITSAEQWESLPHLDVTKGTLARELELIHYVDNYLKGSTPFVMTLFSPLTIAYKLCGDGIAGNAVLEHLREAPCKLHAGLAVIRDVLIEYAAACLKAGVRGFFFETHLATYDKLSRSEYEKFGVPYDLAVLESFQHKSRITMLHLCRQNVMFDLVADYPVHIINWPDRTAGPSLSEARRFTKSALAGGLSPETLLRGSPEAVMAEAHEAIAQAGPTGFILSPTCVIKDYSPEANLKAARQVIEEMI